MPAFRVTLATNKSLCRVEATGTTKDLVSLAQQLTWLSASVRSSSLKELSASVAKFWRSDSKGQTVEFVISQLELQRLEEPDKYYWPSLFPARVLARGFHVPPDPARGRAALLPYRSLSTLPVAPDDTSRTFGIIADQIKLLHLEKLTSEPLRLSLPWEIPKYCSDQLDTDFDLAKILTVTGTPSRAYAATCREYLQFCWRGSTFDILDIVMRFMKPVNGTCTPWTLQRGRWEESGLRLSCSVHS